MWVTKNPISLTPGYGPSGVGKPVQLSSAWNNAERAMTAADVDGNGKQEVITAGLLPFPGGSELHIIIADYSSATPATKEYTVDTIGSPAAPDYKINNIDAVVGDFNKDGEDEIAVLAFKNIYILKADMASNTILSSHSFNSSSTVAPIPDAKTPAIELAAEDTDKDGFKELLVSVSFTPADYGSPRPKLLIYDGALLSQPKAKMDLGCTTDDKAYLVFGAASIDVGDVFGDGEKRIIVGGRTNSLNRIMLTTVSYHPETDSYDTAKTNKAYAVNADDYKAVKSASLGLKCVALQVLKPGDPEYLVFGGFIYKYDQLNDTFTRQDVTSATSNTDGNKVDVSHGSITNVNVDKDQTYIIDTIAGSFDEAALSDTTKAGREQIVMLHVNKWYGKTYMYETQCYMSDNGTIKAVLGAVWTEGASTYPHPAICAPDVFNRGVRLQFEPEKSTFAFSNPTVVAVLGATPYYSELENDYGALGNVGTTYGTESSNESSTSNGVTANVGVSFGFTQGFGILGIKFGEVSFEAEVNNSFSWAWTSGQSISKNISFTNYYSDDAVVVMVIPYDIYCFKVYNTETNVESEMVVNIPYSPITKIMPVTDYNNAAKTITNAPLVGPEVLDHTVGDPRSYPQSSTGLSNVTGEDVLLGGTSANEAENFVSAGLGNSHTEQSITTTTTSGKSFDYELDVNIAFNGNLFGVTAGVSAGVGYTRNASTSSSQSTIRTGQVASVPYSQYEFQWCLAAYNYNLTAGSSTQKCLVISYLAKPIGSYPPAAPGNFRVDSRRLNSTSLKWDQASGAAGYRLYRSPSETGIFSLIKDLPGITSSSFNDTTAAIGTTYFYRMVAYNNKDTMPVSVNAPGLSVSDMTVKTQPKLVYEENDALDLRNLVMTLKYSDNTAEDIAFGGFTGDITVSVANGTKLVAAQTGIPITIRYVPGNRSVNTGNLTVNARSPYDLTLSAVFKVGTTNNARALVASQPLSATITLKNNSPAQQQVLVIMALYNDKGTMVNLATQTSTVAASGNATVTMNNAFTLPANVSNYSVKIFIWDGTSFTSTVLTPKSNVVQMP